MSPWLAQLYKYVLVASLNLTIDQTQVLIIVIVKTIERVRCSSTLIRHINIAMKKIIHNFWKDYGILKIVFFLLCLYVTFEELEVFFFERPTLTSRAKVGLRPEDFPVITLCPDPAINVTAMQNLGYNEILSYQAGVSVLPLKTEGHGWIGKDSESVEEVSGKISILKSPEDCPVHKESRVWTTGTQREEKLRFELTRALLPYHVCCRVVTPELATQEAVEVFVIAIDSDEQRYKSMKVLLSERNSYSVFRQSEKTIFGDGLTTPETGYNLYRMKVREDLHQDNEPSYPCHNYEKLGDYDRCLENNIFKHLHKAVNFTPPWMTENSTRWWRKRLVFESKEKVEEYYKIYQKIHFGSFENRNCLSPCKRHTYEINNIGRLDSRGKMRGFAVFIDQSVEKTTSEPQIDPVTLITRFGGIIGMGKNLLWVIILILSSITFLSRKLFIRKNKEKSRIIQSKTTNDFQ